jgi:hypothetical protein
VVTFMIFFPKAENIISAFSDFLGAVTESSAGSIHTVYPRNRTLKPAGAAGFQFGKPRRSAMVGSSR